MTGQPTDFEMKLKIGLVLWVAKNGMTPGQFSKKMGYAYAHAWDLLRGKRPFTQEAFGRFSIRFGTEAAAEILELAKLPNGVEDIESLEGPRGGKVVPLVKVTTR